MAHSLGWAARSAGDAVSALDHHRVALRMSQDTGCRLPEGHAHYGMAMAFYEVGSLVEAEQVRALLKTIVTS